MNNDGIDHGEDYFDLMNTKDGKEFISMEAVMCEQLTFFDMF